MKKTPFAVVLSFLLLFLSTQIRGIDATAVTSEPSTMQATPVNKLPSKEPTITQTTFTNNLWKIDEGPCPSGWTQLKAYCYLVSSETKSQSDAKKYCNDRRGDLVKINSAEENEFVLQLARKKAPLLKQVWIGLERRRNRFYWSDLSVPVYTRWASKEPNGTPKEACCHMWIAGYSNELPQRASGSWNDIACNVSSATPNGLVCKRLP